GQPVAENPVWATARPAIARVDAGLVTGVLPGEAEIVASYAGVAASAVITVVEATLGQIAFRSHRDDPAGDLYLMNADGTGVVRLTTDPSGDFDPDWSPDGSRIAFWSRRDGNPEIYVMNADG
ncbi:MAG: hypothetical protein GWN79_09475, partial [Actinobacteria bacterium]|nr:hypothetical protein [Actinomycetota bacterium]NIS31312.1 hypothetical protein [Actinomycetota bacterium]NIU19295.1 hypothetical protein [Actinomycetota bacterium]NIU66432.1 hypothetical protein [Actinomycetota bacterium]NIV87180.1 hypothetical protein [Actinomycetota bacterium]